MWLGTALEEKRCRQIDKCRDMLDDVYDAVGSGIDSRKATCRLIKLRNYLNRQFPDKKARKERDDMLDAIVRINNWCAQDLAENAYVSEKSGNYYKTLMGVCDICQPFVKEAIRRSRESREGIEKEERKLRRFE